MEGSSAEPIRMMGVELHAMDVDALHAEIERAVACGARRVLANHNVHSVYLFHHDPAMRSFYERAHRVHFDGMPLVWMARRLGYAVGSRHRVTYVDWIGELVERAAGSGWRLFYLGGREGVAAAAAERLRRRAPGLAIETHPGYFDTSPQSPENLAVLDAIREFAPHVLLVGMGMPRQERWILDNLERLEANVLLNAGACFDYVAGVAPTPPRWAGRVGLEWLFRLAREPGRLARRYLVEPWFVLRLFLGDLVARRAA